MEIQHQVRVDFGIRTLLHFCASVHKEFDGEQGSNSAAILDDTESGAQNRGDLPTRREDDEEGFWYD
jgi:hypothetical protein